MATSPPSDPPCLIIDSNILIAIGCKEAGRHALADAGLVSYASRGFQFFAPACILSECLYVLAEKVDMGIYRYSLCLLFPSFPPWGEIPPGYAYECTTEIAE